MNSAHCVDYLRQYIQCNADLTPMFWQELWPQRGPLLKPYQTHTCRDFDRLHRWVMDGA